MSAKLEISSRPMRSAEEIRDYLHVAIGTSDTILRGCLMSELQIELLLDIREYQAEIAWRLSDLSGFAESAHISRQKARETLTDYFCRRATDKRPESET